MQRNLTDRRGPEAQQCEFLLVLQYFWLCDAVGDAEDVGRGGKYAPVWQASLDMLSYMASPDSTGRRPRRSMSSVLSWDEVGNYGTLFTSELYGVVSEIGASSVPLELSRVTLPSFSQVAAASFLSGQVFLRLMSWSQRK